MFVKRALYPIATNSFICCECNTLIFIGNIRIGVSALDGIHHRIGAGSPVLGGGEELVKC